MLLIFSRFLIILAILSLQACAGLSGRQSAWPDDLPSRDYFLNSYREDTVNAELQSLDEYLAWVKCFYRGSDLYANGWNSVTGELLLRIKDPESVEDVRQKMQRLGRLIGGEWAKNNQTRIINTRHVSIWGSALLKSLQQGETLAIIGRIDSDVDDLLAYRIAAEVITTDRFYAEEDVLEYVN